MPAINVARTDTFEVQRQKINQIGDILSNISAGGSDLQTGNLKLGDGTRTVPSLSFISDSSLGIYKPESQTIGYVVDGKKIADFSPSGIYSYKDLIIQRRIVTTGGTSLLSGGSNYDAGVYSNIPLIGGTGDGALATLEVTEFVGDITSVGSGYTAGFYSDITLSGGSGTGATVSIEVSGIVGEITNPGSGYLFDEVNFGFYLDVPLTGGSGSGAIGVVTVSEGGEVVDITITDSGVGYNQNDILSVNTSSMGNQGSGFQFQVNSSPGIIEDLTFFEKGTGYQINDVLSLPGNRTGVSTTLDIESTNISVSSTQGIFLGSTVTQTGGSGALASNTTVTNVDSELNTITLSDVPTTSGSATLTFGVPYGIPISNFSYTITNIGTIDSFAIDDGGNGYSVSDQLTVNPSNLTEVITYPVTVGDVYEITFVGSVPTSAFSVGDSLKLKDGEVTGVLITTFTTGTPDGVYTNVPSTTNGSGSGATFDVTRDENGDVVSVEVNSSGYFYSEGDVITLSGGNVGGSNIVLEVSGVSSYEDREIYLINSSGGNITSITLQADTFSAPQSGRILLRSGTSSPDYVIDTVSALEHRYFIDVGNGPEFTPSFSLYAGNVYGFDLSNTTNTGHIFSLSEFRDGTWSPSTIDNVTATLSTGSNDIIVNDSTGILPGMSVLVSVGPGTLLFDTTVTAVNGTTVTLSDPPTAAGSATLSFSGIEYTDGVVKTDSLVTIQVTETTPSLYYYCQTHQNMGGSDNNEGLITIDLNNPKVFGTGFLLSVVELDSNNVITGDIETGDFTALKLLSQGAEFGEASVTGTLTAPTIAGDSLTASSITSSSNLNLDASQTDVSGNFNVGTTVQVTSSSGNITTSGILKTTSSLSVNDILNISTNNIFTSAGNNLLLTPPSGNVVKVDANSALIVPSGNTSERPGVSVRENGAIRFNTETNQYEGYSDTSESWSSLGGVRDLDGNTYILAEESIGSNDNTLWFINDNVNTVRFTPTHQEFVNVKKIRSVNVSAPDYTEWTANTPVSAGQYLKYRNNIFEVITGGTTASSGSEPLNVTGDPFSNGSTTLQYSTTAVSGLTFEEISEVRIDPLGFTDLVVNNELRFSNNEISTEALDLSIRPYDGQKVVVQAVTSLVIPVGDNNSKGNPSQGSIRYNTDITQFEGFNGAQWSSLGGVRDVDGNTYIIPETSPGSNENVLYFYNNNSNTLRVTENQIELDSIDTITSSNSDILNLNASTITFDSLATTLDNTSSTETFLFSTKDNFDFGLSSGLNTDHLLRLTNTGNVIFNLGFGTGTDDNVSLLNSTLTSVNLKNVRVSTSRITLVRGSNNFGNANVYSTSTESSSKLFVTAHNITTGDKELVEFLVTNKGTDIFFTDTSNIKTGAELISTAFDTDSFGNVRITVTADSNLAVGNEIEITIVNNTTKR